MINIRLLPPKVEYKRPKFQTMIAFLESKGWTMDEKTDRFWLIKPPSDLKFEGDEPFRFHIPFNEKGKDYEEATFNLIEGFSTLYDIPLQQLFNLFSLSMEDVKEEVEEYPRLLKIKMVMVE